MPCGIKGSRDSATGEAPAKPEPSAEEQAAIVDALRRHIAKPRPARVAATTKEDGGLSIGSPYSDEVGWLVRLQAALGTASKGFAQIQLHHLASIATSDARPEAAINAMLAAVQGFEPQNEMEAQLAVQMAATHQAVMQALQRLSQAQSVETMEALDRLSNRLMRTYVAQVEAMTKLQRGGEQTVRVEHVHVYQGGQAIVGQVTAASGQGGGRLENGRQADASTEPRALATASLGPLLRQDAQRNGVPIPRGEGQGAVPDARRRQRKRRAEG